MTPLHSTIWLYELSIGLTAVVYIAAGAVFVRPRTRLIVTGLYAAYFAAMIVSYAMRWI